MTGPVTHIIGAGMSGLSAAVSLIKTGHRVVDAGRFVDDAARGAIAGVRVARASGAAATAGLIFGDIITAIAGRAIRRASDVASALQLHRPGDAIAIAFSRDGERRATTLRLTP